MKTSFKLNEKTSQLPSQEKPEIEFHQSNLQTSALVSNVWSMVILAFNIWTVFSTILWVSVKDYYDSVASFFEVIVESVLLLEITTRILLKAVFPRGYDNLNLYHVNKKDKIWGFVILLIGSMPIYTIYTGLKGANLSQQDANIITKVLAIKFLRSFEIQRTLNKVEEILFYKKFRTLVFVKFIKNCVYVLLITHISACSWLFIASTFSGQPLVPDGVSPSNHFAKGKEYKIYAFKGIGVLYYERNNMLDAPLYSKYADACVWAVGALTGCNFSEVTPKTLEEVVVSLIIMLMGILLLAKIFSDFASLRYLLDIEDMQTKEKSLQALKLCRILNVPLDIKYKVQTYYELDNNASSQSNLNYYIFFNIYPKVQHFSVIKELPKTLYTDIMLSLNKNLINKSNLFNFGPPDFVFMMAQYLYPQVSMAGDLVIRVGEYANEMYFIKSGEVEILATDGNTRLNVLSEGGYFGEIGLLLTQKRTVSVRALTFCHFEVINKDDFCAVLDAFPQQKEFILKIAEQRNRVCTPQEFSRNGDKSPAKADRYFSIPDDKEEDSPDNSPQKQQAHQEHARNNKYKRNMIWDGIVNAFKDWACVGKGLDFRASNLILPTSHFHQFWSVILGISVFVYLMGIPFEIAFVHDDDQTPVLWIVIEVTLTVIYFLDIFVNMNTSIKYEGIYISNKESIIKRYINEQFVIDFIAFLPINYIFMGLKIVPSYMKWIKILRFVKVTRSLNLLGEIGESGSKKRQLTQLTIFMIFFIILNNFIGCIEYMIALADNDSADYTMLKRLSIYNVLDMPLIDQSSWVRYIYFQYWAWSLTSSGAYGDIVGVTPSEKYFGAIAMLLSRIFFAFYVAEVSAFISSLYSHKTANLAKKTTYDQWMKHIKLSDELRDRTQKYNECVWQKYQGIDENQILDDLPKSTKQEILEFLLLEMLQTTEIFPNDEVGLFSNVVKDFKFIMISKGEFVFKEGEIVEEIFFIIEGEVSIFDPRSEKELDRLMRNDFFGDSVLIDDKVAIRTENAIAITDVSLGVLHLSCIKNLWKKYPTLREKMNKIAEQRTEILLKKSMQKMPDMNNGTLRDLAFDENAPKEAPLDPGSLNAERDDQDRDLIKSPKDTGNFMTSNRPLLMESMVPSSHKGEIKPLVIPSIKVNGDDVKVKSKSLQGGFEFLHSPNQTGSRHIDNGHEMFEDSPLNVPTGKASQKPRLFELSANASPGISMSEENFENKGNGEDLEKTSRALMQPSKVKEIDENKKLGKKKNLAVWAKEKQAQFRKRLKKAKIVILSFIVGFEWIYRPLNLAFDMTDFIHPIVILFEIFFALMFTWDLILIVKKNYKSKRKEKNSMSQSTKGRRNGHVLNAEISIKGKQLKPITVIIHLLYICPFQMIFTNLGIEARMTDFFLITLQLSRLFALDKLAAVLGLNFFKKRYALANILIILAGFIFLNHIFACIFILMANVQEDLNNTWLAKIPAPQPNFPNNVRPNEELRNLGAFTIYIHATYWSYVTTSHVGVGDVTGINHGERVYSTIVIALTTYLYALLFGNLASMVDDLTPKFQKEYEENYRKVMEYVKMSNLEVFMRRVHTYYSYLWQNTKGVDENTLLNDLPNSLKSDIFLERYKDIVLTSKFFLDAEGAVNQSIFYYFSRKCYYNIYLKNDIIVNAGQEVGDVYIILEGGAATAKQEKPEEKSSDDKAKKNEPLPLLPGEFFGGILPNTIQYGTIFAVEETKVAVLPQEHFLQLKEAFPEWYDYILKSYKMYKLGIRILGKFRKALAQRKPSSMSLEDIPHTVPTSNIPQAFRRIKDFQLSSRKPNVRSHRDSVPKEERPSSRDNSEIRLSDNLDISIKSPGSPGVETPDSEVVASVPIVDNFKSQKNDAKRLQDLNTMAKHLGDEQIQQDPSFPSFRSAKAADINQNNKIKFSKSNISKPAEGRDVKKLTFLGKIKKQISMPLKSNSSQATDTTPKKIVKQKSSFRNNPRSENVLRSQTLMHQSTIMAKHLASGLSSLNNVPSHVIQEQVHGEEDTKNGQSHAVSKNSYVVSTKNKIDKSGDAKKADFLAKNLANKFVGTVALKSKMAENQKQLKYYIDPNSHWRTLYELTHTLVIIYSLFAIPLQVGFSMEFGVGFEVVEILILVEQVLHIIFWVRTAQLLFGMLTLDWEVVRPKLWEQGILTELLAIIPFNLIFGILGLKDPILVFGLLRLNRLFLLSNLPVKLDFFSARYPKVAKYMTILKPIIYLALTSHFIACSFSFLLLVEPTYLFETNFYDFLELAKASVTNRYLISLEFFMSISTTVGYAEFIVYNNYERIIFILCVYLGDALFALILGWFGSNSSILPEKFTAIFNDIRKIDSVLEQQPIPKKIKNRIINYFTYIADNGENQNCLQVLSGLLPQTILKEMTFEQTKIIHAFPLIEQFKDNKILVNEIVANLKHSIYFPHDYIISRNDRGSEAYMIAEGTVQVLSPINDKKVIGLLEAGAYFGELGLYTATKRLTSFIADSFCVIYILESEVLKTIMESFPTVKHQFETFSKERIKAYLRNNRRGANKIASTLAYLRKMSSKKEQTKTGIQNLLRSCEVPSVMLETQQKNLSEEKLEEDNNNNNNNVVGLDSTIGDYIEEEEMNEVGFDTKKSSFRIKPNRKERRFSRMKIGREKSVARAEAVTVTWGINLN